MTLDCPWCGPRVTAEFHYRGEFLVRPRPDEAGPTEWRNYLYVRRNRSGRNEERWYHSRGCCRFLRVERDLASNTVLSVGPA